ncbi:hypothetical protein LOD99_6601 [Oopsacas minuta]|uniref:Uncharacterized protein n=1 Tax=Oopsacas minuta TaxID=111878 RepID=A0AAV7JLY9_9METZ|nr:hypothetical protein LOD99_6601 [Oopsacas minuta]
MSFRAKSRQDDCKRTAKYTPNIPKIISQKKHNTNSSLSKREKYHLKSKCIKTDKKITQYHDNPDTPYNILSQEATVEKQERAEAIRLILLETKHAKERAVTMGAVGWSQKPIPRINKQFAKHIVSSTLAVNKYNIQNKMKKR